MGIPYFNNLKWSDITRDERFFCSVLYHHASKHPALFAEWLIKTTKLPITDLSGEWNLGFEVCFYRDMLWQMGDSAPNKNLPPKRTFDLCLFGERDIIVIEAKVFERFDAEQNREFEKDKIFIKSVPGMERINVHVIALASKKYFDNAEVFGKKSNAEIPDSTGTLDVFNRYHCTWAQLAKIYNNDPLLSQADALYKSDNRKLKN